MATLAYSPNTTLYVSDMTMGNNLGDISQKLETYYTEHNIYKSVVFCTDDDETYRLGKLLSDNNHSVCTICESDLWDDRDLYRQRLVDFSEISYRIIIVSATAWSSIIPDLEVYVLPEQNLIVFSDLDDMYLNRMRTWLVDARRRGFIQRDECEILYLSNEL